MKTTRLLLGLSLVTSVAVAETDAPEWLEEALSLNLRARYEGVENSFFEDAEAITLRTRLGFAPELGHGWSLMLEGENIYAFDSDSYNQAGLNPGGAGKAVIADPEITELNQAWLGWANADTRVKLGRQRLVLDNARFVGDVGWRQNQQTFDAVVLQYTAAEKTRLNYFYLDRINRVLGRDHPAGEWHSESHGFNVSTTELSGGTLTGYAYLLEFENAALNSCATYGASWVGKVSVNDDLSFNYRVEAATQSDYGNSPLDYSATYTALEAGLAGGMGSIALGHETLGSDNGVGFRTPLATLHGFNGWADLFLATPGTGLQDLYVKAKTKLRGGITLLGVYHWFDPDAGGGSWGQELDLAASRSFGQHTKITLKFADFDPAAGSLRPTVQKIWLQGDFAW
jgi:hypothetical protein